MGMRILGSSYSRCDKEMSRRSSSLWRACSGGSFLLPTDPDPEKFEILDFIQGKKYLYVEVKYPNCTNYEGLKILVIDSTIEEVKKLKVLDPHFLVDNKIVARFRPSLEGKALALKICEI